MKAANITLMCPYVHSRTLTAILRGRAVARNKEYGMRKLDWGFGVRIPGPGDDGDDEDGE